MSTITSIKPQKFNNRVNVYLDGEFAFGLDLETYMKSGLKIGNTLSDEEIAKLKDSSDFTTTYQKLLNFSTLRPRSEKEIRDWLHRKKVPEHYYEKHFSKLKRLDLIDDEKFAKWWIDQRLAFKQKSKKELSFELMRKGINKILINQLVNNSMNQEDEVKTAKALLEKKLYKWQKFEGYIKKQKISQYLAGKGFGWDVIKTIVDELR